MYRVSLRTFAMSKIETVDVQAIDPVGAIFEACTALCINQENLWIVNVLKVG